MMRPIIKKIQKWTKDRNLHTQKPIDQIKKLKEECIELEEALTAGDEPEIIDAIGDIQVVLNVICRQLGYNFDTCLELAYDEIKDRKGKMVDGVFVKEETAKDIKKDSDYLSCFGKHVLGDECVDCEDLSDCRAFTANSESEKKIPDCFGDHKQTCDALDFLCVYKSSCKKETGGK